MVCQELKNNTYSWYVNEFFNNIPEYVIFKISNT